MKHLASLLWILIASASAAQAGGRDAAAVSQAIDREIQAALDEAGIKASPRASDSQFLRRVSVDISGRVPTAERAAQFLASSDPERRRKLVDELLASPRYGEHQASIWTDRINAAGTPPRSMTAAFRSWLAGEFNQGRGWDRIVHDMLTAEGLEPAGYFVRANLDEPGLLADTTARFFLGVQIQCAECHRHPFVSWKQADYWGLAAFYTRVKQVQAKGGKRLTEEALPGKKAKHPGPGARIVIPSSGENKGAGKVVAARFLGGVEPLLPDQGPVRPALAEWVTSRDNPYFAQAAVNRLWAHFFGSGFINPVDDFHDSVEGSHPALLQLLAREFVDSGFDLKHLVRCITGSDAYQRSSTPLADNSDEQLFSRMALRVMTPDVLFDSLVTALGEPKLAGGLGAPLPYELYAGDKTKPTRVQAREEFLKFFDTADDSGKTTVYTHGIPQVLALMNAQQFNGTPPIVQRLVAAHAGRDKALETLFLAALARPPTAEETRLMTGYLERRQDASRGYAGVLWILLNSSEFIANH